MPTMPKIPPSSLRPDPSFNVKSARSAEPRPYLLSANLSHRESVIMRSGMAEPSITLFPHESEDARLTGSTRSLFRRLLALNLPVSTVADSQSAKPAAPDGRFKSKIASA